VAVVAIAVATTQIAAVAV
ncbi:hypothetical protein A2U01_0087821, partial [Trifolium medium]|nr:hypothetical protein [Trifolium medium]